MKKYVSVWMLLARSTIYKILDVSVLAAIVEFILFYRTYKKEVFSEMFQLEYVVAQSGIMWVFVVLVILTIILLGQNGYEFTGKQSYTWKRLQITEKSIFLLQVTYNVACFLMVWAIQLFVAILFGKLYLNWTTPQLISGQTLFLAFYRSNFLHTLLPLEDIVIWIRNFVVIVLWSVICANLPKRQRRERVYEK